MIRMEQYELIRTAHRVYGKGIREIAREFGHHRKTVRRALSGQEPVYRRKKTPHSPVMETVAETVGIWIKDNSRSKEMKRRTKARYYCFFKRLWYKDRYKNFVGVFRKVCEASLEWSGKRDSNSRPSAWKAGKLT